MNVSELARKLNVSPNYLRDMLPKIGFDIGRRAIKVDDRVADTILQKWPSLMRDLIDKAARDKRAAIDQAIQEAPKEVELPPYLTVREFSQALHLSLPLLMTELMKNGILSSVNERLDFDTVSIVAEDLGFTVRRSLEAASEAGTVAIEEKIKTALAESKTVQPRPPIIVVMGHVDHGKTKLLDAIRHTNVVEDEAGGITQHIGAYQVDKNGKILTFIDTPGHEAFRAMRSRGAKVADIAVLVVAADDGIKPQTREALSIIQGASLPFVVAINKIDKPEADAEKIKKELGAMNLIPEEWGGQTVIVPLSAKTGEGIDHLLEILVLVAELHKEIIVADQSARALGTVIEAHIDKGEGPVATLLVQNGTLRLGDLLIQENTMIGKVRLLKDYHGGVIAAAAPSTPVRILGLKEAPEVGDILEAGDPKISYGLSSKKKQVRRGAAVELMAGAEETSASKITIPVLLKADVLGSLEAIIESIVKIEHPEVGVQVISKGLGNITDADVLRAEASHALVAGFHVQVTREAADLAQEKGVTIKIFDVIYHLLDELKERLTEKLVPEIVHTDLGRGTVLAIFRQESNWQIVGTRIDRGLVKEKAKVKILRHDEIVGKGTVERLQAGKESIKEATTGAECGIQIAADIKIIAGDNLEFYQEEERVRTLG